jgi:hypothetical protein
LTIKKNDEVKFMLLKEFLDKKIFVVLNEGKDLDKELTKVFCCDLLSIAMSKAPSGSVWVTVMGNVNAIAVSVLAEIGCIILAEDANLDETALAKAREQGVTVLKSSSPIFDTGLIAHNLLNG